MLTCAPATEVALRTCAALVGCRQVCAVSVGAGQTRELVIGDGPVRTVVPWRNVSTQWLHFITESQKFPEKDDVIPLLKKLLYNYNFKNRNQQHSVP